MIPRILFLDDDENRHGNFRRGIIGIGHSRSMTRTADETIFILKRQQFDLVFLDHDLSGETYVSSDRHDTGMEVVRWLVKHKTPISLIVVHSCNPAGAVGMHDALKGAGYRVEIIPFTLLIPHLPRLIESALALIPHPSSR